jgi:hypothetical protein
MDYEDYYLPFVLDKNIALDVRNFLSAFCRVY